MVEFGQVVIGAPGSGKTTYCIAIQNILKNLNRECVVINLDFANDLIATEDYRVHKQDAANNDYMVLEPDIDVRELIKLEDIMEKFELGPNGSFLYAMQYLKNNINWLKKKIKEVKEKKGKLQLYYIFDCPGQVELYVNDNSIISILKEINEKEHGIRFCVVNITDSTLCKEHHQYISSLLLALSIQIHLPFPFLNFFSKSDLINEEQLDYAFDYYLEASELDNLVYLANKVEPTDDEKTVKIKKKFFDLEKSIVEMVEDFNLVGFVPISAIKNDQLLKAIKLVDKSVGYYLKDSVQPNQETAKSD